MVRWILVLMLIGFFLSSPGSRAEEPDGESSEEQIAALLEVALGEGTVQQRLDAIRDLQQIGDSAVPALVRVASESSEETVRRRALESLERIAPDDRRVQVARLAASDAKDYWDRSYVIEEFGENAEAFLIECTKHSAPLVRRNALYWLRLMELPRAKVVPIYEKGLKDSDDAVRLAASVGLFRSGVRSPQVVQELVRSVGTEGFNDAIEETIQRNYLYFNAPLARRIIDPESSDQVYSAFLDVLQTDYETGGLSAAFNPLREALHSGNRTVQVRAAIALVTLEYNAPSVANVLAKEIETSGPMRDAVLDALENSYLDTARLDEAILSLTRSEDPELVIRGFDLARSQGTAERHAEEMAEYLLDESRLHMAVAALDNSNQTVPFKPEYVPPLKRLIFQGRNVSPKAINVLLNMGEPGTEEAMKLLDKAELLDSMRIDLIQKITQPLWRLPGDHPLRAPLDRVAKNLNHENPWVTTRTAIALLQAGYDQGPLIPVLLKGYASHHSEISDACYGSLLNYSKEDDAVVAFLLKRLEDTKPEKHKKIVELLSRIGSNSPQAVDIVVEYLLSDRDIDNNTRLLFPLNIKQPVMEGLASQVDQGTTENRRRAMNWLRDALKYSKWANHNEWKKVEGKTPPAGVIAALSAEDEELRFDAAMLLLQYRPTAEEALPVLKKVILSDEIEAKWDALVALESFGPAAAQLLPELLALLRSDEDEPNYESRGLVLNVLSRMGPEAAGAVPDLIELLDDPEIGGRQVDWRGHSGILDVLANIGEAAKPAEPFLIEMLPEAESLTPIAKALKSMGGSTDELIAEIDRRLDDPVLCYQAVNDLQVICDIEPVTPRLIKIFKGDDLWLKREVADMLSVSGLVRDPVLVQLLKELLLEESPEVREKAIGALAAHHVPVGVLIERLQNDEKVEVRSAVVESLAVYVSFLLKWYPHFSSTMSKAEIDRSVQRGDVPVLSVLAVIPVLEEVLREPHSQVNSKGYLKIHAAYTLAKFGYTAKRSLPLLLELHGRSKGYAERLEFRGWGVEKWEDALLTAIWSIDLETAIENELPLPKPRRDW